MLYDWLGQNHNDEAPGNLANKTQDPLKNEQAPPKGFLKTMASLRFGSQSQCEITITAFPDTAI